MKKFYVQNNIGKARYVVNHHDGVKKYSDGSDFFDVTIFKNKKKLVKFLSGLQSSGYIESSITNSCTTNPLYWDCDCFLAFIHKKSVGNFCPKCKTNAEDQPDSRVDEIQRIYDPQNDKALKASLDSSSHSKK